MRLRMKKGLALLLALLGLIPVWALASESVTEDFENGIWQYETEGLSIHIIRRMDAAIPLIWYEAELRCSPENPLLPVNKNPMGRTSSTFHNPEALARGNKLVFAVNDDYYGDRIYNKEPAGLVIRRGKLLSYDTYSSGNKRFPNLDTMALLENGGLYVFESKEKTATDYFDMGAVDVFAFGPILLRGGEINPRLAKEYRALEPRVGFGMVAPYHYLCVVAEGRNPGSKGVHCEWLALRLKELGATEALNLDGGQTAALVFMGEKINVTGIFNKRSRIRNISSMIGAGQSGAVPDPE